ncbi:MAG: prepilin-type N-terminal cleavage/methylation domain-containing protein [Deltaproteobacteria bacterium]|nr:prepilin-type N-terminal cleavage/methylation domain-containing protein [Deltaproteobacteria bacterium]
MMRSADGVRRRMARGFTLLEVLVAVAVLGLALVSLLGLHVRNLDLIARDAQVTEATLLARGIMAEVDAGPFPDLGLAEGDFEEDYPERYPDLRWEREVVTTPVPDVREVRVRVFRGEEASGDDVTLTYYVRRR